MNDFFSKIIKFAKIIFKIFFDFFFRKLTEFQLNFFSNIKKLPKLFLNFFRIIFSKLFYENFFLQIFFGENFFYRIFFWRKFFFLQKYFCEDFFHNIFANFFCFWCLWNNVFCEIFYSKFWLLPFFFQP